MFELEPLDHVDQYGSELQGDISSHEQPAWKDCRIAVGAAPHALRPAVVGRTTKRTTDAARLFVASDGPPRTARARCRALRDPDD